MTEPPKYPEPGEDRPASDRNLGTRLFNLAMFVVGGFALWWMLRNQSWEDFREHLSGVGGWFAVILALELAALCCDAAALHAFMRPEARMIAYWRVLGAQASGRAINVLTPGGALGEATKLTMLVTHAPRARVLSSIVLLNLSQIYLSTSVMLLGIPITLLLVDLPHGVKVTVGIGLAVLVPLMVALGIVIHRGAVATIVGTLRRVGLISPDRARGVEAPPRRGRPPHPRAPHAPQRRHVEGHPVGDRVEAAVVDRRWSLLLAAIGVTLTPALMIGVLSIGVLITWISRPRADSASASPTAATTRSTISSAPPARTACSSRCSAARAPCWSRSSASA